MWLAIFELPQSGEFIVHLIDNDEIDEVDDGNFMGEENHLDENEDALLVVFDGLFVVLGDFVVDDTDVKSEELV